MKIIHLNTYAGNGGAGRACLRLHQALVDQGIDSRVCINFSLSSDDTVYNFSGKFFQKWITAFGIVLERLIEKYFTKPLRIPFSFPIWGCDISAHPLLKQSDIIHIHWINHAFLRPRDLAKLAKLNKPIIWTMHDSNTFTGGCHVRYRCEHYQQECGNCPVLKNAHATDWSHKIWQAKQKAYDKLPFHIISPSNWMANAVKKSKLLSNHPITVIPNTLNIQTFKPTAKQVARQILRLDATKFVLMSGFMPSRKDLHKGTSYLVEAIELFVQQYATDAQEIELILFGNHNRQDIPDFKVKTTFLGIVSDDNKLALCYSAADVFLAPSLDDNLPNTVMESLSCGTPVVAFTTGGIPDMVSHQQNGYLATYKSSPSLAEGINWVYKHPQRETVNTQARQTVEKYFSPETIANKHISLYQTVINNHV